MKQRALHSIMALVLVLGMALTLAMPVGAATVTFTGDVPTDFTGPGILTILDPGGVGDVGLGTGAPPGAVSGWDMVDLRLTYDAATDTLYVGINTFGIAGDADGDGNPSNTADWLAAAGGTDNPSLGGTETIAVFFDLNKDGLYDVIAGVPGTANITGFTVANFVYLPGPPIPNPPFNFGASLPGHIGAYHANPSAADPDFEFTILNFSTLPVSDSSVGGFIVGAFLGSIEDNGIGEDSLQYEQNPHTITTIVSSAATVVSGQSVTLNVTEANTGNVSITSPQVAVTKNGTLIHTLVAPPSSGDTGNDGILGVGETWSWNNISGGPITGTTTFVARGSGIAPGDFRVNYLTDPLEEDDVVVDTINPNTAVTITVNATLVKSGGTVSLNVTEANTGDDPLTSPRVEVRKNGTLIHTLVAPPSSGDTGSDGILGVGETWRWNNVSGGAITAFTTFEALGFGTDPLGQEVSYAAGYLSERATVNVNFINPNTAVTIAVNATTVKTGGLVSLNVTEANTGTDPLTSPRVEVRKNGTLIHTLVAPPSSGDTGSDGVLGVGETWRWNNISGGPITAPTTFEALGFGTDPLGQEVSYATGYLSERATVTANSINPNTAVTIAVSATKVVSGDSVTLNVTEANTGTDPLTNPRVEVRKNGTLIHTLVAPPSSGDTGNDGILGVGETWRWNNVSGGAITALTTFEALGFGTDPVGNEVSYAKGYLSERATVSVSTINPNTAVTIIASATSVAPGDSVTLNVTEANTGGDPLTSPRVEVRKNGTLIHTLVAPPSSGDTGNDGILGVGETWRWNNVPGGVINAATTFEALGFGTDSLGNEISYATGHPSERATVRVEVRGEGCLQICKFQDTNVNAMWDPGEPWLPDWRFHVTGPDGYDTWVVTGPDGCVALTGLLSGTYTVTEELEAGWYNTRPGGDPPYEQDVIVEISLDCARVEFGNREEIRDLPPQIPAMNQWGIIAMIAVFAGLLVWTVRRKRLAS